MTCHRCGHLTCPHPDPVYAGLTPSLAAAETMTGGRPLAGDARTCVTGAFVDQRARGRGAFVVFDEVDCFPVHAEENACAAR